MTRQAIIEQTIKTMNELPEDKAQAISDFADFISKRYEEYLLSEGIQKLITGASTFDFLNREEDLYSLADVKEVYNG